MGLNTNLLNRLRYTLWAPGYDLVGRRFNPARRRSVALLDPKPGERLLIVGGGTGCDLPLLSDGVRVVCTDLTPAMLDKARRHARPGIEFAVMDGHALEFEAESFDAVILHLILAVIPEPARCLGEAARVLKPGGRIVVLDKFVPDRERVPFWRRIANLATNLLATDITRRLGDILAASGAPLRVAHDEPVGVSGFFRIVLLRKA
ncbi:MAG TPA: methyltransferase domain-containing protein [Vicinamibacteria bacterium]|nr:methyltransferase domain-containing protein [Vicinamibacteria bacterium]